VHTQAEVHGLTVVPIPGTRRPARVEENTAAAGVRLTPEELKLLEPVAGQVAGDRYADMRTSSAARE
jgi:aryl-alcohol dehydrogenase-like predicted oxidoreductase